MSSNVECKLHCQNCDNECTILYDPNDTSIKPMICPFCGDSVEIDAEETEEDLDDLDDEFGDNYGYSK